MALQPKFDFDFLLDGLEKRPQMFVVPTNYDSIVGYLEGFGAGCIHSGGKNPLDGFREFLLARIDNYRSYGWSQIVEVMAQRDGQNPQALLFQLLREFRGIAPGDKSNRA
jgi:hypothetical protein